MPTIIKVAGRAKRANVDGETIYREEQIFVPSERGWFRILDTYDHFCYYNHRKFGTTMMCSCGSPAGVFGFDAYSQFQSVNMGRAVCCISLMQTKRHADGSSG